MKKVITTLFALLVCVSFVFAQGGPVDKGSNIIAGSIGFTTASGDLYENAAGDGQTAFSIVPSYWRFLIDQLAVGVRLGYMSTSQGDNKDSQLSIGPHVSYFFKLTNEKMFPFVTAAFTYNTHGMEWTGGDQNGSGTTFAIEAGLGYALGDHYAVLPQVGYYMDSFKWDVTDAESNSGSRIMVSIGLAGFIY